jgi:uncharacterized cupredoxin-like copper-binding protein
MNRQLSRVALYVAVIVTVVISGILIPQTDGALATSNLAKQPAMDVNVALGNEAGNLQFFPNHLQFESGHRYNLHLSNPSNQKHYFTAKDFADGIWSQKVDAGNVEIKGAIHELELRAHTQADWVFIPLRSGTYSLRCTVPGHSEAGMVGTLEIAG